MNPTLETIHSLRTIHGDFSTRDVSNEDLEQVLASATCAANASARQSYSIIVIDDRERMRELFSYQGSRALIFCVDYNRIMAAAMHLGQEFDNTDIIGFITGSMDTMLAAQTAVIAAKSLKIDTMITNGLHRNNLDKVYELLNIPQTSCFPLVTVILGYAQKEPVYKKGRLSNEHIIHYGQYHLPDDNQLKKVVAEYDDHTRHIGMIDNWEELGFNHYLDWFYTKWTGKPDTEKVAKGKVLEIQERLRKSGFWWPES
ncbi:MAG TPA: nitroreductase family protein [Longilinea sp.]|nr:nitroreductase family protein [Longilinea sp.]